MKKTKKVLVLLSGGADSATCLAKAVKEYGSKNVICLNAYYGQILDKEMECAKALTEYYDVEYIEINIAQVMKFSDCTLLKNSSKEVVYASYKEQTTDNQKITSCVPFRNGVFISIAAAIAESKDIDEIWYGAHGDDYAYPDCSPAFIENMKEAVYVGTQNNITLFAPLEGMKKHEIIEQGLILGVPYEKTWSCYGGKEKPCGKCASCIDRRNAFIINETTDPLEYEEDNV